MSISLRRGPVGEPGKMVVLQGSMKEGGGGLLKWGISLCGTLLWDHGGFVVRYLER
jgi:hypothetical protein